MERAFHIVVVEDSETQAFKMRMLLEEQGWEISIAGAAESAEGDAGAAVAGAPDAAESRRLALEVRREFLHAWRGYERYAWGHDELQPLSTLSHDWYGPSLLMTPVDSLDSLIILGLNNEARRTRELIDTRLSFDQDIFVKNFEITTHLLGGLL